ncbi:uncharacterized protein LOC111005849 isoform X2 [Momordica charantia]|uniref:Uncharacterized protein LOC111005849 isoform X2 n=1 Tax=Momordica charantia TaxID=3673 RepID=A0A6J1BUL4_MOMCH|nr:uncharacterized protein LOC111005849 isoform X2 [Momordica charantia]
MERTKSSAKPRPSTADLLTWSEVPPPESSPVVSASAARSHQPSDRISKVLQGGQLTDEEAESLLKKKNCSGYKMKEMTGSGIFAANGEGGTSEADNKTGLRMYQQTLNGVSQISFAAEEGVSAKKPSSVPEVAKQRELSGTLQSESDARSKKQISDAKNKELSGHDIFGAPPEITPRSLAAARSLESKESKDMGEPAPRTLRTSVKVSNPAGGQSNILFGEEPVMKTAKKLHNQKFQELTGNDIFKGDAPPGSSEKSLSSAKLREMSGNDIFADGKAESRDYFGGVRKPPGGESSISLV